MVDRGAPSSPKVFSSPPSALSFSCSSSSSASAPSNRTSLLILALRLFFLLRAQKNLSSQSSNSALSYTNGKTRVNTRIQFSASRSGAISGSGNEGWFFNTTRREHTARISVSRFASEVSRVRRISTGENREKTSSVDSGNSQNYQTRTLSASSTFTITSCKPQNEAATEHTPVQYGSSAGMFCSSESLKMPCLKTSFDSEAPIFLIVHAIDRALVAILSRPGSRHLAIVHDSRFARAVVKRSRVRHSKTRQSKLSRRRGCAPR